MPPTPYPIAWLWVAALQRLKRNGRQQRQESSPGRRRGPSNLSEKRKRHLKIFSLLPEDVEAILVVAVIPSGPPCLGYDIEVFSDHDVVTGAERIPSRNSRGPADVALALCCAAVRRA